MGEESLEEDSIANILLVEDEPIVRALTRIKFEKSDYENYEMVMGENYDEALDEISPSSIDAVITDIDFKTEKNGLDLLEKIKKEYQGILVYVMSGTIDYYEERIEELEKYGIGPDGKFGKSNKNNDYEKLIEKIKGDL